MDRQGKAKRKRTRECADCAALAEKVSASARLARAADRAEARAETLAETLGDVPERGKARRQAAIVRWYALARVLRRKASEARGTVAYRCSACLAREALGAETYSAWQRAADDGAIATGDGVAFGAPVERPHGRYSDGDPVVVIAYPEGYARIPVDADALADGRYVEARLDWHTLAPGERIDGAHIERDGWSHVRPRMVVKAGRLMIRCFCGDYSPAEYAHECEYFTRKGKPAPVAQSGSRGTRGRKIARAVADAVNADAGVRAIIAETVERADRKARAEYERKRAAVRERTGETVEARMARLAMATGALGRSVVAEVEHAHHVMVDARDTAH